MTVGTIVFRDLFGAVWSLSLVGAVRRDGLRTLPFESRWRADVKAFETDFSRMRDAFAQLHGLELGVPELLSSDTPWTGSSAADSLLTSTDVRLNLALMARASRSDADAAPLEQLLVRACRRQAAQLLEGLVEVLLDTPQAPLPLAALSDAVSAGASLAGESSRSFLEDGAAEWRASFRQLLSPLHQVVAESIVAQIVSYAGA